MPANAAALPASVARSASSAGRRSRVTVCAAATFIAVGNTSFDDWPRLTSSFGWTSRASPRVPPRISDARLASTSLTFMLVCVPEPVCQTARGNSAVVPSGERLVGGRDDRVGGPRGEQAERGVDACRRPLDDQQRADQRLGHLLGRDPEVQQRALRLRAPEAIRRHVRWARTCRARCARVARSWQVSVGASKTTLSHIW